MKVLLFNGSPHQNGNTAIALGEVAAQLQKNGIDSETVWIGNQPVQRAFYSKGEDIAGKPAAAVAVCRRGGATASFEALNMRALANNMAFLLKATGGVPAPGRGDEPWAPMHFIR